MDFRPSRLPYTLNIFSMRGFILALILLLELEFGLSQSPPYVEIKITDIRYNGDKIKYRPNKVITIDQMGKTEIISLGQVGEKEIWIQLEMLKSDSIRTVLR